MGDHEGILRKIQKLIDKAYGTTNEAEASAFLSKADELMLKYSLNPEAFLDPHRASTAPDIGGTKPERREVQFLYTDDGRVDWTIENTLRELFRAIAAHLYVRIGNTTYSHASCIGYPADLDMVEMFFLRMKLHMLTNLTPKIDPAKDWVENLVTLKNVGYRWEEIHSKFFTAEPPCPSYPYNRQYWERRMGVNFTKQMKDYCERTGTSRTTASNIDNWRADFIGGYTQRLKVRLREAREETVRNSTISNLPALIGNKLSEVEEFLFQQFPDLRPHPDDCDCDWCHRCTDPKCERPMCVARRKPVRAYRGRQDTRIHNGDAYARGRQVADTADIGGHGRLPT